MTDLARIGIQVDSNAGRATRDLRTLGQQGRRTDGVAQRMNRTFMSMRGILASLGVVVAAHQFVQLGKTMGEFQKSMSGVLAVTKATDEEMQVMTDRARELGATTVFSASQAAEGMRFLGMAGFDARQTVEAMPSVLNLAAAATIELGSAADITSNIMSAFAIEAQNTNVIADALAAAASSANTDITQMGDAMKFVGPVARSLGISMQDAAAAVGALSNAGIQGTAAGTGLRRVLSALASPTSGAAKALSSLGISIEDVNPKTKSLTEILEALRDGGLEAATAFQIFGQRGAPAVLALTSMIPDLERLQRATNESAGEAERMSRVMRDNLPGDIKEARSAFEELVLSVGDQGATGALRGFVQGGTRLLRRIGGSVNSFFERFRIFGAGWVAVLSQMNTNTQGLLGEIAERFTWLSASIGRHFLDKLIDGFTHLPTNIRAAVEILIGIVDRFRIRVVSAVEILALAVADQWNGIKSTASLLWLEVRRIFARGVDSVLNVVAGMADRVGNAAFLLGLQGIEESMVSLAAAARDGADAENTIKQRIAQTNRVREAEQAIVLESIALIEAERRVKLANSRQATQAAMAERDAILRRMNARLEERRKMQAAGEQGNSPNTPASSVVSAPSERAVEEFKSRVNEMDAFAEQASRNIQDHFANFLFDPFDKGLKGMLKGFVDVIRRMVAEATAAKLLGDSGGFFASILGAIGLGGGRANGGLVGPRSIHPVNERDPEVFSAGGRDFLMTGSQGGMVKQHQGGSVVNNIHVTVPANVDPSQFRDLAHLFGREIDKRIDMNNRGLAHG